MKIHLPDGWCQANFWVTPRSARYYQQEQTHWVRWLQTKQSLSTWNGSQENMTPPTLMAFSSHSLWWEWDQHMRFQLDVGRDIQKTGWRESPSEGSINAHALTVSAFCLLWEGKKLMRAPLTEVAAVSVLHWSTDQKKKRKKTKICNTSGHLCTIIHYKSCTHCCPLCWIYSPDPCWERKKKNQWWLHDFEVTGTDGAAGILTQSAANRRKYRDMRSVTADYTWKPRCEAERAGGAISSAGKSISNSITSVPTFESEPCD